MEDNSLKHKIHYTTGYAIFVVIGFVAWWLVKGTVVPYWWVITITLLIFTYFITE